MKCWIECCLIYYPIFHNWQGACFAIKSFCSVIYPFGLLQFRVNLFLGCEQHLSIVIYASYLWSWKHNHQIYVNCYVALICGFLFNTLCYIPLWIFPYFLHHFHSRTNWLWVNLPTSQIIVVNICFWYLYYGAKCVRTCVCSDQINLSKFH